MKNKVQFLMLWILAQAIVGRGFAQFSEDGARYRLGITKQINELLVQQYEDASIWFGEAYAEYPTVPRGMLEAVAFQYTRFSPNIVLDTLELDPLEKPKVYSVMGLTLHGKGVFRETARLLAETTPYSLDAILWQPGTAVKAYACAFAQRQVEYGCFGDSVEQYKRILVDLCELPIPEDGGDDFAVNSFLYMIYYFLDKDEYSGCGAPPREIDFSGLFGDEYARLSGKRTSVSPDSSSRSGATSPDYSGALFVPAASCNYTSGRGGTAVSSVTVHYTQGTYAGSIAWFQNCNANVSAHYVIRSVDGQVTQMVREADKAWHVGVANSYTIGIEHEAYGNIYSYFTMNMYQASANLVKDICSRRPNINPHRIFYRDTLDNGTVLNYGVHSLGGASACTQIRGHQHYPSQTHTDPGQFWNWNLYYKLINDNPQVITSAASTGTFTDSGGATGPYGNDERKLFLIDVPGADSVVLTFHSFELEPDYDFMWIYNGGSVFAPLLGRWNTQSPGRVVAAGNKMLVEFRSDCATTSAGWYATWNAVSAGDDGGSADDDGWGEGDELVNDWEPDAEEPALDNVVPQTTILTDATQWITGNFIAHFNDMDDSGIKWRFFQIMESDGSEWSARQDQGFLCDNFDHVLDGNVWVNNVSHPWTVQNGELRQNDVSTDYAGIAAHHNGSAHGAYLYDFYLKFNEGDICSFFFNCGNAPSLTSLFSGYEVCFDRANRTVSVYRLVLGAKRLLKKKEQVHFLPGTAYFCRVVYDHTTGEIVVMRHANRILRAVDNVLATTPDSFIGFVTRNASVCVDNLRVYGSRTTSVPVSVGASDTCNMRRQAVNGLSRTKLKSVVVDKAYRFSSLVEKSLKVDYTPPSAVSGLTLQTETVVLPNGSPSLAVSASWSGTSDAQSGIKRYWYHNSAMSYGSQSNIWVDNGTFLSCYHCYTANPNQLVEFGVVVENGAGLRSTPAVKYIKTNGMNLSPKGGKEVMLAMSSGKKLTIQYTSDETEWNGEDNLLFEIFDLAGKRLKYGHFKEKVTVDMEKMSNGLYFVRVCCGLSTLLNEKIVLAK